MAGCLAVEGGRGRVGGKGATGWVHGEASIKRSYDTRQRSELPSEAFERHVRHERASGGALVRLLGQHPLQHLFLLAFAMPLNLADHSWLPSHLQVPMCGGGSYERLSV